jgi:hypothetical protein
MQEGSAESKATQRVSQDREQARQEGDTKSKTDN